MRSLLPSLKKSFISALLVSVFSYGPSEAHDFDVDQDAGIIIGNGRVTTLDHGKAVKTTPTKLKDNEMMVKTEGVFYCTAICMRGKTKKGAPVRGLYHWDSSTSAYDTFKLLKEIMIKKHSVQRRSISTLLIGSKRSSADWEEELMEHKHFANIQTFYTAPRADGDLIGLDVFMHPTETTIRYVTTE